MVIALLKKEHKLGTLNCSRKGKIFVITTGKPKVKTNDQFIADTVRPNLRAEKRLDTFVPLKANEYLFPLVPQDYRKWQALRYTCRVRLFFFNDRKVNK